MITKIPLPYTGEGAVTTCPKCGNDGIVYTCNIKNWTCRNCNLTYNPFRKYEE